MITAERLKELLSYDPETGLWTWIVDRGPRAHAGNIARSKTSQGYSRIKIDGLDYSSAPLAFLYMTGKWQTDQVDHIDRDRGNNRWANLRLVTSSKNNANRSTRCDNRLGVKGVTYYGRLLSKPYCTRIKTDGKTKNLGYFATIEEASAAYIDAANRQFGEFACGG
jgi:hypothetical protein